MHTVKSFSIVNEADVFLEFPCFVYDPADVGQLISDSSAFSKTRFYSCKFCFTYFWSLAWGILTMTLLACEVNAIVQ